jgi:hypothetical protein
MTVSTHTTTTIPTPGSPTGPRRPDGSRRVSARRLGGYAAGLLLVTAAGTLIVSGPSAYEADDGGGSAYTRPTPALGGETLAAYVADHQEARLARRAG